MRSCAATLRHLVAIPHDRLPQLSDRLVDSDVRICRLQRRGRADPRLRAAMPARGTLEG